MAGIIDKFLGEDGIPHDVTITVKFPPSFFWKVGTTIVGTVLFVYFLQKIKK